MLARAAELDRVARRPARRRRPRRAARAARHGPAHRALRAGRHRPRGPPYTVTESQTGVRGRAARRRRARAIFFPLALGAAHHPVGARRRPDDAVHVHRRLRRVRPAAPAGRRSPCRAAATRGWPTAAARPYLATPTRRRATPSRDDADALHRRSGRRARRAYEVAQRRPPRRVARDCVHAGRRTAPALRVIGQTPHLLRRRAPSSGCRSGRLGEHGLPVRASRWCSPTASSTDPTALDRLRSARPPYLDPGAAPWPAEYPAEFRDTDCPPLAGYASTTATTSTGRRRLLRPQRAAPLRRPRPGRVPRGLPRAIARPARRARPPSSYDAATTCYRYGRSTDPLRPGDHAPSTTTGCCSRARSTDPNGNPPRFAFSPAGLWSPLTVRGKDGERRRHADAPSTRFDYDLLALRRAPAQPVVRPHDRAASTTHRRPTCSAARARRRDRDRVEYSDGFGRLLQTRAQAEDALFGDPAFGGERHPGGPVRAGRHDRGRAPRAVRRAADNVIVSGWQVYDNKGRVVEKYEPFFAAGCDYARARRRRARAEGDARSTTRAARSSARSTPTVSERAGHLRRPGRPGRSGHASRRRRGRSYTYDANDNAGRTRRGRRPRRTRTTGTPRPASRSTRSGAVIAVDATQRTTPGSDWFVDARRRTTSAATCSRSPTRSAAWPSATATTSPNRPLADRQHRRRRRRTVLDAAGNDGRAPRQQGRARPARLRRAATGRSRLWARDDGRRPGHAAPAAGVRRQRRRRTRPPRTRRGAPEPARASCTATTTRPGC